ncbi:MBL fold metallo-hydrolase [Roseateles sp. BYS87W]|uniref:MBL fold metallo-hydrolase n=1 Tax=Pelomonas baiyunensis TaxID=3299026 RepID=A0ABW7GWW4_9BURK
MRFCNLGSGSGGNATLIEASQGITRTRVLVDAGFSLRELNRRLLRAGCEPDSIDALFITHEHGDHIGCALGFAALHRVPVLTSRGTWLAVRDKATPDVRHVPVQHGTAVDLGDLLLHPFSAPHDANEPLQLTATDGARRLGVVTDLGSAPASVVSALQGCDALLLECNHDEAMLRAGRYPPSLKRRILGTHGHLSNEAAALLLQQCWHADLSCIAAAHLSEHNNRPDLAVAALQNAIGTDRSDIRVADPKLGLDWLSLG